ncbi:noxA, partial [Symbiodinium sp. KB8]
MISRNEWHPFTISSASYDLFTEDSITLHIRIHKGGWTERLKDYLNLFNPRGTYPLFLYRRNEKGQLIPGKDRGPDGKQLLRVDGPHAAPAQAYVGYSTVMLVGAGIGLTPS